jgi:hypothetical protein
MLWKIQIYPNHKAYHQLLELTFNAKCYNGFAFIFAGSTSP